MTNQKHSMLNVLKYKLALGPVAGFVNLVFGLFWMTTLFICDMLYPKESIDIAEDFDLDAYKDNPEKFGDHMFDIVENTTS